MSAQTRLAALMTELGTDYKTVRTFLTGSSLGTFTGLNTTAQDIKGAINELKASGGSANVSAASETVAGIMQVATQAETDAGAVDTDAVTPLKLKTRLAAYAQPLSANLTALANVVSGAFGRTLLGTADANAAKTALGLATVATSGSAADLTGVLGTAQLPPLAIEKVDVVASQAAMLALVSEPGDVAKRSDTGRTYMLAASPASTLANWVEITAQGDVMSVAGRTGAVVLTKVDVGLANVDNTSDANKPVSTAQSTALGLKMDKASNLSDLADKAVSRTNLSVYSQAELGNPETDLVALYNAAKA